MQEEGDKGNTPEVEDAQEKENDTDDSKEDTEGAVRGYARGRRGCTGGRRQVRRRRGHTLVPAKIHPRFGIGVHSFDKTIDDMNRIQDDIVWGEE